MICRKICSPLQLLKLVSGSWKQGLKLKTRIGFTTTALIPSDTVCIGCSSVSMLIWDGKQWPSKQGWMSCKGKKEKMFGFGAYHTPKTVHLELCRLYQINSTRGTKQELIVHLHINKVLTSWQVWCVYITGDKLKKLNELWRWSAYSVDFIKWHSVCTYQWLKKVLMKSTETLYLYNTI